jgi:hypothetical protein
VHVAEIAESAELVGRGLDGRTTRTTVTGVELVRLPGSALLTQRVRCADGTVLLRRSLRDGSDDPALPLLDNEIRALARLNRAFRASRGRPFPALVAYDMDSRDPWALVTDHRGRPARDAVGDLLGSGLVEFTADLFHAVAHLPLVELVHHRLDLDCLRLSGTAVQIVTFEHATLVGEPRPGLPAADPADPAHPADDVLAAGRLAFEAFTGHPLAGDPPDLSEVSLLAARLPDVFDPIPARRPTAADVVRRLGRTDLPTPSTSDDLGAGRAAFDRARRAKLPPEPATPRPAATVSTKPTRRPGPAVLALSAVAVLAVLALVLAWGLA